MAGPVAALVGAAVALPRHRRPGRGGRVVAEGWHDEDVVTLAATAALAVTDGAGTPPAALLLATVSGPFAEGGNAQVLAEVLDLVADDLFVLESGGSLAAGGAALATACALVSTGRTPVLLVAADRRRDRRGQPLGDGAVALLLDAVDTTDESQVAAHITHLGSRAEVVRDRWRLDGPVDGPTSVTTAERSLGRRTGGVDADDEAAVAVSPLTTTVPRVGEAGCATFPLVLLRDLDRLDGDDGDDGNDGNAEGDEGARAVVTASGVTHAFGVRAGPAAAAVAATARRVLAGGVDRPVPPPPDRTGFDPYASPARAWRERAQDLRLLGQRDPTSGEVLYPPVPAATADGLEPVRLARHGQVLTTTRDHIVPLDPPMSMAVVALDGGGRFYGPVADGRDVAVGDRVSLVLRRLHDGGGLPQWFWKVSPEPSGSDTPVGGTARPADDEDR